MTFRPTRRDANRLLLAASASLVAPMASLRSARAEGGPAIARHVVGDVSVTTLSDGTITLANGFFPNADAAEMTRLQSAAGRDPGETIEVGLNAWLLRAGDRVILVDTGAGDLLDGLFPGLGALDGLLAAEGVAPGDVTDVVLTHMHGDHVGGLARDGRPAFPNATLHVQEPEWAFWRDAAAAPEAMQRFFDMARRQSDPFVGTANLLTREADLGDGISLVPAPGHTPGHAVIRISSGDATMMLLGDTVISGLYQLPHPDWTYALDVDPAQAAATRARLFDIIAADGLTMAATHLAFPGAGRLTRHDGGFSWRWFDAFSRTQNSSRATTGVAFSRPQHLGARACGRAMSPIPFRNPRPRQGSDGRPRTPSGQGRLQPCRAGGLGRSGHGGVDA